MKFFKTLIAATLGTLLALVLIFVVLLITVSSSSQEPEPYVKDNTVLKINISGNIPVRSAGNPFDELLGQSDNDKVSLESLKKNLAKANMHDKIKGVWLEIDFVGGGWANLEEAHQLISAFRDSSDKFIFASTNDIGYNEKGYFLATAADSVFSPPESFFEFDGFYSQVMFLEGTFEKLGIDAEVTRHGKYKSAVEPFFRKDLSEESKYQLQELVSDISNTFVDAVSRKTGKNSGAINALLNSKPHLTAQFGYSEGLIDSLLYADEVETLIKQRLKLKEDKSLETVSHGRYSRVTGQTAGLPSNDTDDKIAVIYAAGEIIPEVNSDSPFSNQEFITTSFFQEQLSRIRDDEDIKALVVRVNSPGGSGSTSDAIWRMLQETKKDIPVIVSMGPVAASGGYYIAMAADTIVADLTTITGSIGVFATKFNAKQLLNDELGLTFDGVKSHEHADWLTPTRGFTSSEQKAFQQFTDGFYQTFITKVGEARGMTNEEVDAIAQGRVWTGIDAKEQNLVDVLGGLDKALQIAAEKAGISEYDLATYPKPKSLYELLMGSAQAKVQSLIGATWFQHSYAGQTIDRLSILKKQGPLLLFPYEIKVE